MHALLSLLPETMCIPADLVYHCSTSALIVQQVSRHSHHKCVEQASYDGVTAQFKTGFTNEWQSLKQHGDIAVQTFSWGWCGGQAPLVSEDLEQIKRNFDALTLLENGSPTKAYIYPYELAVKDWYTLLEQYFKAQPVSPVVNDASHMLQEAQHILATIKVRLRFLEMTLDIHRLHDTAAIQKKVMLATRVLTKYNSVEQLLPWQEFLDSSHVAPANAIMRQRWDNGKADAQIVQFVERLLKDIEALEGRYSCCY